MLKTMNTKPFLSCPPATKTWQDVCIKCGFSRKLKLAWQWPASYKSATFLKFTNAVFCAYSHCYKSRIINAHVLIRSVHYLKDSLSSSHFCHGKAS